MLLAKEQGGSVVAGYAWANDGDAVDVPYDLAMELMAIKGGGFYVPEPEPRSRSLRRSRTSRPRPRRPAAKPAPPK